MLIVSRLREMQKVHNHLEEGARCSDEIHRRRCDLRVPSDGCTGKYIIRLLRDRRRRCNSVDAGIVGV